MSTQDEQGRYRVETWSAVRALWNIFGERPDEVVISMYPDMPAFIDRMFKQGLMAESTAVQIVARVVTDHVAQSFTAEQKKQVLAGLEKLMQMKIEEAQGNMTYRVFQTVGNAWNGTKKWGEERKRDVLAGKL